MHISAVAWADLTLMNDSNNNEQLFINLATVTGRRISIIPPAQSCGRCASFPMKLSTTCISLILTILFGCKTSQNHSFIKSKNQKHIKLIGAQKPFVVFILENGDTLKFGNEDILLLLDKQSKNQTHRQTLFNKSWLDISETLSKRSIDTTVNQNLSSIDSKTLTGILESWLARELLLKGKASVVMKNQTGNLKRLNYVFTKDKLGGQQGTFYSENGVKIYSSVIALGE